MPSQAYHDITCSRARHPAVLKAIHAWLSENRFNRIQSDSELLLVAIKGSHWGMRDENRIRELRILVRPEFGLTVVSIYHSTSRLGFIVGLMNSDILQREAESLIETINALPTPE